MAGFRRATAIIAAAAAAALWLAPAAFGAGTGTARVITWSDPKVAHSRYVNPATAPTGYYNQPPGVPDRPNALKVDVYLPPDYSQDPHRRFPLLFLLHGHGDAYDSWVNPQQGDLLDIASGLDAVVVMPEADHGWYVNWWNGGKRGDPAWESYHLDQLLPVVRHRLRILRGRRWHAIAGLSMGGEGALYYASQVPGYFGTAASFSGVLNIQRSEYQQAFKSFNGEDPVAIFGDPQRQQFYWTGHNPTRLVANLHSTRLFVSVGNGIPDPTNLGEVRNTFGQLAEAELHQMANDFVAAASAAGEQVTYREHQGIHDWRYWREDMAAAIQWGLFAKPPAPHGHWTFRTVSTSGEMWGLHFRFAQPPGRVERFTRTGRTLVGVGNGRVTLRRGGCVVRTPLSFKLTLPRGC